MKILRISNRNDKKSTDINLDQILWVEYSMKGLSFHFERFKVELYIRDPKISKKDIEHVWSVYNTLIDDKTITLLTAHINTGK